MSQDIKAGGTTRPRDDRNRVWLGSLPALLVTAVVTLPFLWLAILSFISEGSPSLAHYARMLDNPSYFTIIIDTVKLSIIVTAIALAIGYPTAYFINLLTPAWATLALGLVAIPFWTSLLVRTYAWMVLLQRNGLINSWLIEIGAIDRPLRMANSFLGTTIGMIHIMLPFVILPLYSSMRQIDGDVIRAARNLGASPSQAFRDVFVPLSMPGVIAGGLLTFVLCLGFYVTPQLLGGGNLTTISMKIQQNIIMYGDWGAASSLGVLLVVLVGISLLVLHWLAPRALRG